MPWSKEASIIQHGKFDYWRTWFIEECDRSGLFGVNEKHLDLVTHPKLGYDKGAMIFLEDAPYFGANDQIHRVCGPYEVVPVRPTSGSDVVHERRGNIIVYKEAHPENGPWLDRSVTRIIEGDKIRFKQLASKFKFYPYRFGIRKSPQFEIELVRHQKSCWLCR